MSLFIVLLSSFLCKKCKAELLPKYLQKSHDFL